MRGTLIITLIVLVPIVAGFLLALISVVTPKDRSQEDEDQMAYLKEYYKKRKDAKK